jgi:hypothetical protein
LGSNVRQSAGLAWLAAAAIAAGCGEREVRAVDRAPVVDSAVPIAVALERFRRGLPELEELAGGAPSREQLVREFIAALEGRDTVALRAMVVDQREFAWLYYPSSRHAAPPYELPPDLSWFQMQGQSERGASLLLSDRAGSSLGYLGHECRSQRVEGGNRLHEHCLVRRVSPAGDTLTERLFGLVMERHGRFKFVSYANKLD